MARVSDVFKTNCKLHEYNPKSKPSIPSFDRIMLPSHSIPRLNVRVALFEDNVADESPEEESCDGNQVCRGDPKGVDHEESR